jgi:hypothetical protein
MEVYRPYLSLFVLFPHFLFWKWIQRNERPQHRSGGGGVPVHVAAHTNSDGTQDWRKVNPALPRDQFWRNLRVFGLLIKKFAVFGCTFPFGLFYTFLPTAFHFSFFFLSFLLIFTPQFSRNEHCEYSYIFSTIYFTLSKMLSEKCYGSELLVLFLTEVYRDVSNNDLIMLLGGLTQPLAVQRADCDRLSVGLRIAQSEHVSVFTPHFNGLLTRLHPHTRHHGSLDSLKRITPVSKPPLHLWIARGVTLVIPRKCQVSRCCVILLTTFLQLGYSYKITCVMSKTTSFWSKLVSCTLTDSYYMNILTLLTDRFGWCPLFVFRFLQAARYYIIILMATLKFDSNWLMMNREHIFIFKI